MNIEVIGGILIPFVGTMLGAAGGFFLKNDGGFGMESPDSGDGTVGGDGTAGICSGSSGILDRYYILAVTGSCHSLSAQEQ